jgi:hypothetical protein
VSTGSALKIDPSADISQAPFFPVGVLMSCSISRVIDFVVLICIQKCNHYTLVGVAIITPGFEFDTMENKIGRDSRTR